jgi:hypothetical protein
MPGETKIFKNSSGWYDVDNPTVYYSTREQARDVRRGRGKTLTSRPSALDTVKADLDKTRQALTVTPQPDSADSALTSLQVRLLGRLTQRQGVDLLDALNVITSYGYNAAASYGHMRESGATHDEAIEVIDLDSPDVSLAYGLSRGAGYNHTYSLQRAFRDNDD